MRVVEPNFSKGDTAGTRSEAKVPYNCSKCLMVRETGPVSSSLWSSISCSSILDPTSSNFAFNFFRWAFASCHRVGFPKSTQGQLHIGRKTFNKPKSTHKLANRFLMALHLEALITSAIHLMINYLMFVSNCNVVRDHDTNLIICAEQTCGYVFLFSHLCNHCEQHQTPSHILNGTTMVKDWERCLDHYPRKICLYTSRQEGSRYIFQRVAPPVQECIAFT